MARDDDRTRPWVRYHELSQFRLFRLMRRRRSTTTTEPPPAPPSPRPSDER